MAANITRLLVAGGLLCLGGPVQALELLPDPTRPAVDISATASSGVGVGADAATAGATDPVPVSTKEGLQSVILSPQRRAAVINGQTVELGGKVGDATLVEVRESSVVLQGAQGKRVMELFPGVHLMKMEPVKPAMQKVRKEVTPVSAKNKKKKHVAKKKIAGTACPEQNKDERESK